MSCAFRFGLVAAVSFFALPAHAFEMGGHLRRPDTQSGVDSTSSYAQKTLTWPTGGGTLNFDYYVDSEQNFDFLRLLIDGSVASSWSGPSQGGHLSQTLSAGAHTIRFEYLKDGSVSRGLDLGFVDNVIASSAAGVLRRFNFDERDSTLSGWSVGGTGGGFARSPHGYQRLLRRPLSQAFVGYQSSATTSRAQRTFSFSGTGPNTVTFDYLVDSELNYDFLRVFVDGVMTWQISGQAVGTKKLDVGAAGTHTIAFEYLKDTSVDVGRDLAVIDNVLAANASGNFEVNTFDGQPLGGIPYGWSQSGAGGGFVTAQTQAPIARLQKSTPSPVPTVDGTVTPAEYVSPTMTPLYDLLNRRGRNGTMFLRERDDLLSLHLGIRAHASSRALGSENGNLTLYVDALRGDTLATKGCGAVGSMPRQEDRKVVVSYTSTSGQPTYSVTQYLGSCQSWLPITSGSSDEWPVTVAITEPEEDKGFVHLELRLELKPRSSLTSSVLDEGRFGFAVVQKSISGDLGLATFPLVQGGQPVDDDVMTWATLDLTASPSDARPISRPMTSTPYFY